MSPHGYSLPATAVCPGCGAVVTLPPEPIYPDSPPAICATCDTEVPDYRRDSYQPTAALHFPAAQAYHQPIPATSEPEHIPIEHKKVSRGGLFRSLGGLLAERAENAVEDAKDRFNSAGGG